METSNSAVEMQLNENKKSNSDEVCKLFGLSAKVVNGNATQTEYENTCKTGVMPVLRTIECALNKDFLLEKEKKSFYWAFDTKEMLRGSYKQYIEALVAAVNARLYTIDEARFMADMPSLGLNWIALGLDTVLYDTESKTIYTPNTDKMANMGRVKNQLPAGGEEEDEDRNTE